MHAADPHLHPAESVDRHLVAGSMIFLAAWLWSTAPAIIHLTARDSNSFLFNSLDQSTIILLMFVFLMIGRRRWNDAFTTQGSCPDRLERRSVLDVHLFKSFIGSSWLGKDHAIDLQTAKLYRPRSWLKLPIVWLMLSGLDIGFLAWSTRYVETAIATTVFQLWPAFVIFMLIRHDQTHRLYLNQMSRGGREEHHGHREQFVLTVLAGVGLVFMLGSQGDAGTSLAGIFTLEGVLGISLAILAGAGAALNVVGSLVFGRTAYYRFFDDLPHSDIPAEDRGEHGHRLLLWFTLFGLVIGRILAGSVSLVLGFAVFSTYGGVTLTAVAGALMLGLADAGAIVLIRVGNTLSKRPGVNALSFVAPVLGLTWLLWLGVSLPRFDLFAVGAALILAINVLLQLKPDAERDYSRFGKDPIPGMKFGFTAFIMSIWIFGTVIYLRDDWLPAHWLTWPGGEYWGLLALSATVFALILGFRMARLTARVSHEDELMFHLFRDCEHLVREGVLDSAINQHLTELDTAQPGQLLRAHNKARKLLRDSLRRRTTHGGESFSPEVSAQLLNAERLLDVIAHSKQQGRDLVEMMSLLAFALATVGLGLFSRPFALEMQDYAWSGFISEVFVLLLVSTVSFLAVNLFDIRRERETPLLVLITEHENDYGLFFRYKRNRTVEHVVTVTTSTVMVFAFVALLYGKWQ